METRHAIALLGAFALLGGAPGCAAAPGETDESTPASAEVTGTPVVSGDEAYAVAAADGASYDPPFQVFRPTWLPEGFEMRSTWYEPASATDGSGGLLVSYTRGDASIKVAVGIGDIGVDSPVARVAWGTVSECDVYEDAWSDSYIALYPSSGVYTPNVRTINVSLDDLERVLASLEAVEP
jgi:hypothetical protein